MLPVVEKLEELGWANKTWLTRKGRHKCGRTFDKCSVHSLLTNVLYIGRIRHKENVYGGVHEAIIEPDIFESVQKLLKEHGQGSGKRLVNRHNALLKGMMYCPSFSYAMAHNPTKKKSKLHRYYVCQTAIKLGHAQCSTGSIPAPAIEAAVVEALRCIVDDDGLRREVYKQSETLVQQRQERLDLQLRQLTKQRSRDNAELERMATEGEAGELNNARRHDLQTSIERTLTQIEEVTAALAIAGQQSFGRDDVDEALGDFNWLWKMLKARERVQLLELLVSRVQYDRSDGTLAISDHPTAITALIKNGEEETE